MTDQKIELLPLIDYVPESMRTFLNTPLLLGQFVPCDEEGNVMDAPDLRLLETDTKNRLKSEYQAAKDRVLFDGFGVAVNRGDVVMVSSDGIGIDFYQDGRVIMWKWHLASWDFQEDVTTISDLCGYGLKLKHR